MKILVGYDGSDVAKAAMGLAKKRAMVLKAKIDVVSRMAQSRKTSIWLYLPVRHLKCFLPGGFNKMST